MKPTQDLKLRSLKNRMERIKNIICPGILNGLTREEYTSAWHDSPLFGYLYCMWSDKYSYPLSYEEIGINIGWGWRKVKSQRESLAKQDLGKLFEITPVRINRNGYNYGWKINNQVIMSFSSFDQIIGLFSNSKYGKRILNPNKSEKALLRLANKVHPKEWKFTGARLAKNRIGRFYPDLTNFKRKLIIEHYGSWCHHPWDQFMKAYEYLKFGYTTISIWDYNKVNDNIYLQMIKRG